LNKKEATAASGGKSNRRNYVSQADVPRHTIEEALRLARAIAENYGKEPTRPLGVAQAMGMKPTTGKFETLAGASLAYGFTEGGARAEKISLGELGRRVVAPTAEGDDLAAKREALLRPRVTREFLKKYDGSSLPKPAIGQNVLEEMGVGSSATKRTLDLIVESANELGLMREIKGTLYVDLEGVSTKIVDPAPEASDEVREENEHENEQVVVDPPLKDQKETAATRPTALFVGARKGKARDQLIKLLGEYQIPHKVAEDEANRGRPIPKKVKDTMQECGAAILIFSADEEYHDGEGVSVWKPSDNIVHELGASSILYDDRIIVFKDERVTLASNFESIGFIEFSDGQLDAKVNELLRELIAFKILTLSVNA
jgi:hypothetical protein